MRTKRLAIMLSSAMLFAVATTQAIDREASMIDTLWFQGASYDHSDYAGLRLTGETQIQDCGGEWAILAGIAAGELSMDEGETYDSFGLSLGIQYYVSSLSTLAVIGSYTWNSGESDL
ncbi:MAG: hypothetical protein HN341_06520, partial [Verrucomicrobia bacterium]|nr:hypothetical protein [Verrucomicrobiota bacterium]